MNQYAVSGFTSGLATAALGAVLYFAVTATVSGIDLNVVGVILMVVGVTAGLSSVVWGMSTRRTIVQTRAVPIQPTTQEPTVVEARRD